MNTEVITVDFRRPLPVFPLTDAVLFPHTLLPLHIFEPRYRKMVEDSLDDVGLIVMGLFAENVDRESYLNGHPKLRPWVCVGLIRNYERIPDGRFLMVLQGVCRGHIREEIYHDPYRRFLVDPVDTTPLPDEQLTDERQRIVDLIHAPELARVDAVKKARRHVDSSQSTVAAIDAVLSDLLADTELRYRLLAEVNPRARADWLIDYMQHLVGKEREGQA
jgi:Lon protease-like protein